MTLHLGPVYIGLEGNESGDDDTEPSDGYDLRGGLLP